MPWWSMSLISLTLMALSSQAYHVLYRAMMSSWWEIKKDILPKSVKPGKISQWLMERAHEEGLRPVDVVLTSAQNKHAIKEVIDKIEHYRKGRDVYVVGVTNVGKSTLINAIIQEITGDQMSSRLRVSQEQPWTRLRFRLTTDLIFTIHRGLFTATRWPLLDG